MDKFLAKKKFLSKKQKYKITIDKVYPKPLSRYTDTLEDAKKRVVWFLGNNPQGIARIKQLKADGRSYKSLSTHRWVKNRETGRDRITNL
ncbi:hypothetical protein LCGC14_0893570 [marine sediment metagenome]|uniref:Uncharacterized protein n=1 Tax=marine sediment metagenome TaxID=412755 RepID=A0A0F9S5E1_9ZZZZ